MKKAIVSLLSAVLILGNTAGARVRIEQIGDNEFKAYAKINSDERADLLVVKKGNSGNDSIFALDQKNADSEGNITFSFIVPDERDSVSSASDYDLFIKPQNGEKISGEFAFAPKSDIDTMFTALSGGNYTDVFNDSDYYISLKAVGCAEDTYLSLSDEKNPMLKDL